MFSSMYPGKFVRSLVSRITPIRLNRFSQNSVESWNMDQGINDWILVLIQFLIRIQERFGGILPSRCWQW